MEREIVVVGSAAGAVRAAAACAQRGHRVTWICPDERAVGTPDLPEGSGRLEASEPPGPLAEDVLGPLEPLAAPERALAVGGRMHRLPLRPGQLLSILGPSATGAATWGFARVRAREAMGGVIGSWSEIRSYRDWVSWRYGEPLFQGLFGPYCARRWGPPDQVGAALARWYHGVASAHAWVTPSEGVSARFERARHEVEAKGGSVRSGLPVRRLVVRDGHVAAVLLAGNRRSRVEGTLLVASPPAEVATWLGEALPEPIRIHVARLGHRHGLQVLVPAEDAELPDEVHLVGHGGPFFRITRPGRLPAYRDLAGHLLLHAALDPEDPLWTATDREVEAAARSALEEIRGIHLNAGRVVVRRQPADEPCWSLATTPSWIRARAAFASLGIVGVGRAGTFGHLDPLGEVRFLDALLADVPVGEAHRLHVDPPFDQPRWPGELPTFLQR
ncbi:MAG: hypothetical protein JXB39_09610 [Deltaproteobacteria bacterium]|nr:hypothetical protein [Deltaproteobacteria bacterium]